MADTVASLRQKLKEESEYLGLVMAERNELVKALRKHGQHFGCRTGMRVLEKEQQRGLEPPAPNKHGCTCGLKLLLARYTGVK